MCQEGRPLERRLGRLDAESAPRPAAAAMSRLGTGDRRGSGIPDSDQVTGARFFTSRTHHDLTCIKSFIGERR